MKNKLKILVLSLLLNFITLSQIDTSKICFDYDIVLNISQDLLRYDSVLVELEHTKSILSITQTRSDLKDEQIKMLLDKNINYGFIIENYSKKESLYKKREEDLVKENKDLTRKNKNLKTALIATSSTLTIVGGILAVIFIAG